MTDHYKYIAYGLIIDSEIELSALLESKGPADISIRIGKVPEIMNARTNKNKRVSASDDEFLFSKDNVAHFYVSGGTQIVIEPLTDINSNEIRLFLLGSVFSALLHQRGYLVLHGSAIEMDGGAIIFTGKSGAGKSTLAATFAQKGYRVITDDVCAIKVENGKPPLLIPGFPQIKLWRDAADRLTKDLSTAKPIRDGEDKYNFTTIDSHCSDPLPLRQIYIITPNEGEGIDIKPIESFRKIMQLIKNTYRIRFLKAQGGSSKHLEQCARVAEQVGMFVLHRGDGKYHAQDVALYLEGILRKL